mmetsp:Transcript_34365/g.83645  ORF Transcript_34365/g.83645 Transcript_34365/m.83645 type:complete len:98 (-) Transcript_34365:217-510(-)
MPVCRILASAGLSLTPPSLLSLSPSPPSQRDPAERLAALNPEAMQRRVKNRLQAAVRLPSMHSTFSSTQYPTVSSDKLKGTPPVSPGARSRAAAKIC